MVRSKATVHKADKLLDIRELHLLTSLNTAVCLNKEDLSLPDRWLTNSHQPSMEASRVGMAGLLNSHPLVMEDSRPWAMEFLPLLVPAVMDEASRLQPLNGAPQALKVLATASKAGIKVRWPAVSRLIQYGHLKVI